MLTIRAAATLLARVDSLDATRPLLRALGFEGTPHVVDAALRAALGLGDVVRRARLIAGHGPLRALLAVLPEDADVRDAARRIAAALDQHAAGAAWLLVLLHTPTPDSARTLTIATIARTAHPKATLRLAALRVQLAHVTDSDADTVRALAAVPRTDPLVTYARWTDVLGRDALSARFYRTLDRCVRQLAHSATGTASKSDRHTLALLMTSRLLFLAFLEAKGWLDGDRGFLLRECTAALERGGLLHHRWLYPLCFGTLNTPVAQRAAAARRFGRVPFLNGGLFARAPIERQHARLRFADDAIVSLVGDLLDRYRFTASEESTTWSEAAIDPEMLGRSFESLMVPGERRGSGTFYTPPALVERVVSEALQVALPTALPPSEQLLRLQALRCLDPACGSGAFLVHALERLTSLRLAAGDTRAPHAVRRSVLGDSIFGVDRNPVAVWLCELRLWLAVVIDCDETDPLRVPPLPNLDHHVRVGDSLAGGDFRFTPTTGRRLAQLRGRYVQAVGTRKRTLADALEREERQRARAELTRIIAHDRSSRASLLAHLRTRDLFGERVPPSRADRLRLDTLRTRLRELRARERRLSLGGALPFRFASHLADVGASGGFDLVIGNPPWVRPHQLPVAERIALRRDFRSMRDAPWRAGAARAGASAGFAAQADLSAAFVERSVALLREGGTAALLVPAKLWRALAGGGVRRLLADDTRLHTVIDWSDAPALFDAATYPSLVVATRTVAPASAGSTERVRVHVVRGTREHRFALPAVSLPLGGEPSAPWLLLPPEVRAVFERLRRAGPPLGEAGLGRPTLGVKCGCNEAFLVSAHEDDDQLAHITAGDRRGTIERMLLRPALAGHSVGRPVSAERDALRIVWTHGRDGRPLAALPPSTARWMHWWRPRLEGRRDARQRQPWWTLFRTEAARPDTPRLVWADFGRTLRTQVLDAGDPTVPLNTCYVLRAPTLDDAYALDALLSSPVASAWLDAIAEPARGGWRRFLGWTVSALPTPTDWLRARTLLAPLGRRRALGDPPSPEEHIAVVASAYGLDPAVLTPLLAWQHA
jgi:transposase